MHLVFVTSLVPAGPPESGYEIANQAIIDGLCRAGARVTVLGFKMPGRTVSDPQNTVCLGEIDVRNDTASATQKFAWLAATMRGGITFSSAKLRMVGERDVETALAGIGDVDGYVLNSVQLAGAFERQFRGRPYVFVAHNVEYLSARQNAEQATNPFEKLLFYREARLLKALERRLCENARFVLTLADEDAAPLGVTGRSLALPLVTPQAPGGGAMRVTAFDTGMIGTWTWAPNRVGLEWFLQQVVPLLPPLMTVGIAGKVPRGFPARDPRVQFLGRVEDAKDFLRQCRVISLTSRSGTGVQLKSLETFEMGLPAVATASSLRGIADIPDNVLKADTAEEFASALQALVDRQRTGELPDLDGLRYREDRIAAMDAVIGEALNRLHADSGNR
ncbi:glycosyltransferase [Oricola sp.]|uniref:glycosyltransferase n=1 Tax=Oricola sp. TaxID=1979950 RepID=UPI003BAC7231